MKKAVYFLMILSGFTFASDNHTQCQKKANSHPDMIFCIQEETSAVESEIKKTISKNKIKYNIPDDLYKTQRDNIFKKCIIFKNLDGQRGELFEVQCELNEVKKLKIFIADYLDAMDNS